MLFWRTFFTSSKAARCRGHLGITPTTQSLSATTLPTCYRAPFLTCKSTLGAKGAASKRIFIVACTVLFACTLDSSRRPWTFFSPVSLLLNSAQVRVIVQGFFSYNQDPQQFKEHVRDFLVQCKVRLTLCSTLVCPLCCLPLLDPFFLLLTKFLS